MSLYIAIVSKSSVVSFRLVDSPRLGIPAFQSAVCCSLTAGTKATIHRLILLIYVLCRGVSTTILGILIMKVACGMTLRSGWVEKEIQCWI